MQARSDLWLMRQGESTLFVFYAALKKQVALCKFTNSPEILSTAFIIGLKDRATIKKLIVKAGNKSDELPPDQCLKIASAMQCAVSASYHVQSSNSAPQTTTINQLRHKHTEITQKISTNIMVEKARDKAANKDSTNSMVNSAARIRTRENS